WFDLFSIMFNFLINPGIMLSGGLMVAAGLSFKAALAAGFFGTNRCAPLLSDHGDAGGRLRHPRSGRDSRRLWAAGSKADPLAVADTGVGLLVLVPDSCRRIGHRRGARENNRRHLSADLGQRDLWVHSGVRRGDRLRIAQGAGAGGITDQG